MKYFVKTYGCQMNVADSDEIGRHLTQRGCAPTHDPEDASIYLINTCTVRQHAEDRALSEIGRLRKWKADKPNRKLVVAGCAAERIKDFLKQRFPHVDLVLGARSIGEFGKMLDYLLEEEQTYENLDYALGVHSGEVCDFVTIMRGCNYSCTYCIVPQVRGREIYRPLAEIVKEVEERVTEGTREVTLLGQTANSYHLSGSKGSATDFSDLLEAVARVNGIERIRFMSPHPYYMTERVVDAMTTIPAVCEGVHLPVQSGSNVILKSMLRNYTRESYLELIDRLRLAMPEIVISTDIIVGFPGETKNHFKQTLSLIEEVQFDWGFVFKYSARKGTAAADLDCYPTQLIEERHQECLEVLNRVGLVKRRGLVGTIQDVLLEEDGFGRTRGNYKVKVDGLIRPGSTVRVLVTSAERLTLEGTIVQEEVFVPDFTNYTKS